METLEMAAKTVEEALELALRQLDVEREEVEVSVISKGRAGILGIGAELARVRVTRIQSSMATASAAAIDTVSSLLSAMHVSAMATIKSSGQGSSDGPAIDIIGDDSGLLIGRRGETLRALQFIVNVLLRHRLKERVGVTLDVEQYVDRRVKSINTLASRSADRAVASGRPVTLEPMSPADRRLVHVALTDHPKVTTESEGEGEHRKVIISPKKNGPKDE